MTVYAHPLFDLNLTERIDSAGSATSRIVRHNGYALAGLRIGPDATVETDAALSVVSGREITFTAATEDIDLTALPTANGETVDATGLRLRLALFHNPRNNATLAIEPGPTDGYDLFGPGGKVTLGGQAWLPLFDANSLPLVSATSKVIRLTGTIAESVRLVLALG